MSQIRKSMASGNPQLINRTWKRFDAVFPKYSNSYSFFICSAILMGILGIFLGSPVAIAQTHQSLGATAAVRPVVVIVSLTACCREEAWPEAEEKIKREFIQGGIEVVVVNGTAPTESERRLELMQTAEQYNAAAAVRIVKPIAAAQAAGVDLWITDRVTKKTVYRYLPLNDVGSGESSLVAALKTMELFQGSLQEIHLSPKKSQSLPKSIEKMAESPEYAVSKRKLFRLGGGFSGIFFDRDVGSRGAPLVSLGWNPVDGFLLQGEGWFGVMGRDVVSGGYATSLTLNVAVLKIMWEKRGSSVLKPAVGVLMGVAVVSVEGRSNSAVQDRSDSMVTSIWGITSQMGFALTDSLWLTPSFDIGFIAPQTRINFGTTEVAQFGMPILKSALLLNVNF